MQDSLVKKVSQYTWWHSIDLGQNIVTPGSKTLEFHKREASALFDRVDLVGRSVLDIGAWNGFYSFEAKRRGAARVVATDSYCWQHTELRGRETFELARSVLGYDVEARQIDSAEILPETIGLFDIVLFLGVFYHRLDAVDALEKAASVATGLLIVETHLDMLDSDRPAMVFYPGQEIGRDATNWWGPNVACVVALLRHFGFAEIEVTRMPIRQRAVFHAWRTKAFQTRPLDERERWKPLTVYDRVRRELRRPFGKLAALIPRWRKP
ncbi:DUF1698 domain-containing protein [Rhodoplanes sp. TEM]|uniref:DUF1698 domain-containing protein n=1 Tax=Rhodoplanes tepidamans TaxID=200616 RepID=A0ABT5J7E0_RHOTP|nr:MULTISPECIES: DUF1698 domain-containing protein [Rhodoplanes]MDC7785433.1 DUF1698 domain-containing protein [Rhodoplanes tepidamans]MDC7985786.1 DUF1698 domain-containing protein [Rhodoplanes sp. TEM]MDQ0353113.1 tRNA (mo5U34)-methyltransferase [Rhodoplanes tepidamans]